MTEYKYSEDVKKFEANQKYLADSINVDLANMKITPFNAFKSVRKIRDVLIRLFEIASVCSVGMVKNLSINQQTLTSLLSLQIKVIEMEKRIEELEKR